MTRAITLLAATAALLTSACEDAPACARYADGVSACGSGDVARPIATFPVSLSGTGNVRLALSGDDVYVLETSGAIHRFAFATGTQLGLLDADSPAPTRIAGSADGVYFAQAEGASSTSRLMFWDGVAAAPEALVVGLDPIVELAADDAGAVALTCVTGLGCSLVQASASGDVVTASAGPGEVVGLALTPTHVVVVGGTRGAHAFLVFRRDALDAPPTLVVWDDPEADDAVMARDPFGDGEPYVVGERVTFAARDVGSHTVLHSVDVSDPSADSAEYASLRFTAADPHASLSTGVFTTGWDAPLSTARVHFVAPSFRDAEPIATLGFSYRFSDMRLAALDRRRLVMAARYDEFGSSAPPSIELWFFDLAP